jgi:VIT1/CCC1 family predicted Fe2+/Mn2+ transporter
VPSTSSRDGDAATPSLRDRIESHLGSRDVAHVIYGAIIGLALVLALQAHPPTAAQTVGLVVGTALAVGLAELYSEIVASEARTRRTIARAQVREMAGESLAVVFGAAFPAVFFILAAAGVMGESLAFTLSKWSGLGLICGYGFVAARLAGQSLGRALLHAVAVGVIGGALIALKALLH